MKVLVVQKRDGLTFDGRHYPYRAMVPEGTLKAPKQKSLEELRWIGWEELEDVSALPQAEVARPTAPPQFMIDDAQALVDRLAGELGEAQRVLDELNELVEASKRDPEPVAVVPSPTDADPTPAGDEEQTGKDGGGLRSVLPF